MSEDCSSGGFLVKGGWETVEVGFQGSLEEPQLSGYHCSVLTSWPAGPWGPGNPGKPRDP